MSEPKPFTFPVGGIESLSDEQAVHFLEEIAETTNGLLLSILRSRHEPLGPGRRWAFEAFRTLTRPTLSLADEAVGDFAGDPTEENTMRAIHALLAVLGVRNFFRLARDDGPQN